MAVSNRIKRAVSPPDGSKIHPTDQQWARFWKYVQKQPNGCWLWTGARARYGYLGFNGKTIAAHRFAYRAWPTTDPIPAETPQLDHRCRNSFCVNPDHLDPVTNKENSLRGIGFSAVNARKTHCPKGHRYTPENTLLMKRAGSQGRKCRQCHRDRYRGRIRSKRCVQCGLPADSLTCEVCKFKRQVARNARLSAKRAESLLRREHRRTFCDKHGIAKVQYARGLRCEACYRAQVRNSPTRYRELQAAGLCVQCGKPRGDRNYRCQPCHDRHMESTHRRRAKARLL